MDSFSAFNGHRLQLVTCAPAAFLAYRIVVKGESFRKPKPMPENGEVAVAKSSKKPHS